MLCPYCSKTETKVVDKRDAENIASTRRRRECLKCAKRFTTYERIETALRVIKKDGKREQFDREKLKQGILKSCEKRPIPNDAIEQMISKIEVTLKGKATSEIPSKIIGELASKELKKKDKVAYIRFASVYKDFDTIESFQEEVNKLIKRG
jgi:transcriptional repressor NrdR